MGRLGVPLRGSALVGDGRPHPPAIVLAHPTGGEALVFEPLHQPGQRALAQMDLIRKVLHPQMAFGCGRQLPQDLVFAQRELILPLQGTLERLANNRVSGLELTPSLKQSLFVHLAHLQRLTTAVQLSL